MKKILLMATFISTFITPIFALHIDGVQVMLNRAQLVVDEIEPKALYKMLDSDDDFFVIDIRGKEQQTHGEIYHIDSFKITRGYLEFQIEEKIPNKKATIIVYCCSGKRSLLAAKNLQEMG